MRARNIKPGFFKNELLATADPHHAWIFIGLWGMADREGRLEDRPAKIHLEINPGRALDMTLSSLSWLSCNNFIHRFSTANENHYIQVINFERHQNPHPREAKSEIPAYNHNLSGQAKPRHDQCNAKNTPSPSDSGFLIPDSPFLIPDSLLLETGPRPAENVESGTKKATGVAAGPDRRSEGKRLWPKIIAAIQFVDLQKAFPPESEVGRAVQQIGGWQKLGGKNRNLRGQTEQQFLNAFEALADAP